jgi:hypothetical protein
MSVRDFVHRYLVKRRFRHWTREVQETERTIASAKVYLAHAITNREAARTDVVWLDVPGHLHPRRCTGRVDVPSVEWGYDPAATRAAGPGHDEDR